MWYFNIPFWNFLRKTRPKTQHFPKKSIFFFHLTKRNVLLPVSYTKIDFLELMIKTFFTLKTIYKYTIITGLVIFLVACSTRRNNLLSRNSHALSTKYNILYNGGVALDKGVANLKSQYQDNFWEILPVERMQVVKQELDETKTKEKNADFERSETKATKAIQKHSMNIDGSEKNYQIDEAYLMLGQTRYYDQRFVPALEAFNYVLYKYPTSDKINIVKIWREKTNMRMDNDAVAVENLRKLFKEIKFKDQVFADANATLAQAFINLKEKDSAIAKLKLANEFTKSKEEKARYNYILGQLYDEQGHKDSAFVAYQNIINMKRKAARQYTIHAHIGQAKQFDFEKGDTVAFLKKYNKLLIDRENRPYLDALNHQMGLFYDKAKNSKQAKKYYNASLKKKTADEYTIASNYRNLAEIYFNEAKYVTAGKYYDSTMTYLNDRSREFRLISKKRENLDDVIKYEGIAQHNDSILKIAKMSDSEKDTYFKEVIEKLKKEEEKQRLLDEKAAKEKELDAANNGDVVDSKGKDNSGKETKKKPIVPTQNPNAITGDFYFYNPKTVAFGVKEFAKRWGGRSLVEGWRLINTKEEIKRPTDDNPSGNDVTDTKGDGKDKTAGKDDEKYTTAYYLKSIPTATKDLDSIAKERNFAYYQLGSIYKEKFKEYQRAADKLEKLLVNNPEERLVLPSMYNLYKIYEILDKNKAADMKARIIAQYPDSRYAQIISNSGSGTAIASKPDEAYDQLYADYLKGNYREVLPKTELAIEQFTGEELLPKFELLKANLNGKLKGVAELKKGLNYVALTYPNTFEGKQTEKFITERLPQLEALAFNTETPTNWKILFKADNLEDKETKKLLEKITNFAKDRTVEKLTISTDIYTLTENFFVIHGMKTVESAQQIAQVLRDFKDYKIAQKSIVISSENYKVLQAKKNLDEYMAVNWLEKPIVVKPKAAIVTTAPDPDAVPQKIKRIEKPKPTNNDVMDNGGKGKTRQPQKEMDAKTEMESDDALPSRMPPSLPKK